MTNRVNIPTDEFIADPAGSFDRATEETTVEMAAFLSDPQAVFDKAMTAPVLIKAESGEIYSIGVSRRIK